MTRSRGSWDRISGLAAVPRITLRAPLSSQPIGGRDVADAAADAAGEARQQALDQRGVAAGAHGGVEVDHRDLAGEREPLGDRHGIAGVDRLLGAADELDGLAALEVDAGDDHGRTLIPCSCR